MLSVIVAIQDEDDRDYVASVYEIYGKKLFVIANTFLHDTHDSEDCVIDTFAVLIDKLQTYRTLSPLHQKNFLVKVCRCIAINKYGKTLRRRYHEIPIASVVLPRQDIRAI